MGTVTAVDAATGELKITEAEKKQPLTIVVKQDAVLRRFPGEMGGGMMMSRPAGAGNAAGQPAAGAPQGGTPSGGGPGAGPRRGGNFNIQEMMESMPAIAIADVKPGEMIIVSSTKGADPARLTAISLLSGAEPLLTMIAARQPQQASGSAPNPAGGLGNSGIQFGIGLP